MARWHPDFWERFEAVTVFDLLIEYITSGRIKLDRTRVQKKAVYHDPCNYGRKSEVLFGHGFYHEPRWILNQCVSHWVNTEPDRYEQYCCGGGGGLMLTSYDAQREYYSRRKIDQIKQSGAELVVVPCHGCHGQIRAMLDSYGLQEIEIKYLWELVAEALVV